MRHTTWLQNRTPAKALDGKTPYKIINKKKPYLGGIQEFGTAAYVKDLKAGKLDARAQLGRFVGYDSESKGYRIYWPAKRTISVERNVIFNGNDVQDKDTQTITVGVQSEGEIDKVIQHPEDVNEDENQTEHPKESQNIDQDKSTKNNKHSTNPIRQ